MGLTDAVIHLLPWAVLIVLASAPLTVPVLMMKRHGYAAGRGFAAAMFRIPHLVFEGFSGVATRTETWFRSARARGREAIAGQRSLLALGIAAGVATGLWALLVFLLQGLDFSTFQRLGHDARMSWALGWLLVAASMLPGLVLTELLGLTSIVPAIHRLPRGGKVLVAVSVLVVFDLAIAPMQARLGHQRAELVRQQAVSELERAHTTRLAELEAQRQAVGDDPSVVRVVDAKQAAENAAYRSRSDAIARQYDANRGLDPTVGQLAAVGEAVTSWGPIVMLGLGAVFAALLVQLTMGGISTIFRGGAAVLDLTFGLFMSVVCLIAGVTPPPPGGGGAAADATEGGRPSHPALSGADTRSGDERAIEPRGAEASDNGDRRSSTSSGTRASPFSNSRADGAPPEDPRSPF